VHVRIAPKADMPQTRLQPAQFGRAFHPPLDSSQIAQGFRRKTTYPASLAAAGKTFDARKLYLPPSLNTALQQTGRLARGASGGHARQRTAQGLLQEAGEFPSQHAFNLWFQKVAPPDGVLTPDPRREDEDLEGSNETEREAHFSRWCVSV
jgi:hypothetical protein